MSVESSMDLMMGDLLVLKGAVQRRNKHMSNIIALVSIAEKVIDQARNIAEKGEPEREWR